MNNRISLDIKKIILEGIVDNTIDTSANFLKQHKGKIALAAGALAYHLSPEFKQVAKNVGHAVYDPIDQKLKLSNAINKISYGNK